jgi:multisubunit Na+/H+ antiporter MnhC subunit
VDYQPLTGKWLYWFVALMVVYGVLTMFPDNKVAAFIGLACAGGGVALAKHQIAKNRKEK